MTADFFKNTVDDLIDLAISRLYTPMVYLVTVQLLQLALLFLIFFKSFISAS